MQVTKLRDQAKSQAERLSTAGQADILPHLLVVLLSCCLLFGIFSLPFHIEMRDAVESGGDVFSYLDGEEDRQGGLVFLLFFTGITFIGWTRASYVKTQRLGATDLRYSPTWAVLAWFIPLANLVIPKQIMNDVWRASDPALPAHGETGWKMNRVNWLVDLWWIAFVVAAFGLNISTTDRQDLEGLTRDLILTDIAFIAAAVLAIIVVIGLSRRISKRTKIVAEATGVTDDQKAAALVGTGTKHPDWKPLERLGNVLRIVFYVWIVFQAGALLSDTLELRMLSHPLSITFEEGTANDDRQRSIAIIQIIFLLVTAIIFLTWFRRAYRNLPALGAHKLRTKKGWAVGSWFVPLLNLVRPKQIADDIWRASHPYAPRTFDWTWHEIPVDPLVHIWWGAWIAGAFVGQLAANLPAQTIGEIRRFSWLHLLSDASLLAAAVAVIPFIKHTTHREHLRAARLESGRPMAPMPPPPPPLTPFG
jgi:Domain of unknown function (DUF4328)